MRDALLARRAATRHRPFLFGLSGAQGSGKSTVGSVLREALRERGLKAEVLSLDDVYLPRVERARLGRDVHPLLQTRGAPGTHDLALAHAVFDAAATDAPFRLPRFDKATDDPFAPELWPPVQGPVDVILFEGWCVGAAPQSAGALVAPINTLEALEDQDGAWRTWVNQQLGGAYRRLFARLHMLAMIAAPGFQVVERWRREQEQGLRKSRAAAGPPGPGGMSDQEVARFVQFFERITVHALCEMPARADIVVYLDERRQPVGPPLGGAG